jgi:hypothetical protein
LKGAAYAVSQRTAPVSRSSERRTSSSPRRAKRKTLPLAAAGDDVPSPASTDQRRVKVAGHAPQLGEAADLSVAARTAPLWPVIGRRDAGEERAERQCRDQGEPPEGGERFHGSPPSRSSS